MKKNIFLRLILSIFSIFAVMLLQPDFSLAGTNSAQEKIKQIISNLQKVTPLGAVQSDAIEEPPRISISAEGYVRHLGAPPLHFFPVALVVPGKPEDTARNFIRENSDILGIKSAEVDFKVLKSKHKISHKYVRFMQTYANIPVFGAQIIVQLNEVDGVEYLTSDIARNVEVLDNKVLPIIPTVSSTEAVKTIINLFKVKEPDIKIQTTTPELMIFDPSVLDSPGSIRLIWSIKVNSDMAAYINEHILLDAHTGVVVRRYPLNKPVLNREIHDSNNTTADPGTLTRNEGGAVSGIQDVDNAYDFLGDAYNFYFTEHGRDSIDGNGMLLSATVRYCAPSEACPYANAFWDDTGLRLYFGDGFTADDVVGHEYTHGVTEFESNLIYENHSGAINESLSDVWGEFIDLSNNAGTDTALVRWEIGEDITIGSIRDMSDPPVFGDPDRMHHPNFIQPVSNPDDTNDYGGVHTNSGVNNKLAYLLTDGDTFNGRTITGLGINRVADLYYEVNSNLLLSGANYTDLYNALTQAAINLGWTNSERDNLYKACLAVELVPVIQLPQTGQMKCYDTAGTEIDCAGTGQDGEIQAGVVWPDPRFEITYCNTSGPCANQLSDCDGNASTDVVTDTLTGLMWIRDGNLPNGTRTWNQAIDYANNLTLCGYTDWVLPNVNELESLVNADELDSASWLNLQGFINVQSYYWSSTTVSLNDRSWVVSMWYGYVDDDGGIKNSSNYNYVLPVRSGQTGIIQLPKTGQTASYYAGDDGDLERGVAWPSPRFADTSIDTVTDNLTGLVWTKDANVPGPSVCSPATTKTWQEALDYVKCLNNNSYLGYNDWRLPNRRELKSLIDYSNYDPALPTGHPFTNMQLDDYWSSTTNFTGPVVGAWHVYMHDGHVYGSPKDNYLYVWPVRGGQVGTLGLLGDINVDGIIDISDVILVLRIALGLDPLKPCSDINNDGVVDISDVILTLRMALGLDQLKQCI